MNIQPVLFTLNKIIGEEKMTIVNCRENGKPLPLHAVHQYNELRNAHKALKNYQALENDKNEKYENMKSTDLVKK